MFLSNSELSHADNILAKHEMRASWISTVVNIDLAPGMNESEYRAWAETTIQKLERKNFNAIVFQVKPTADALYPSDLAPWSRYITGQAQGIDPGYDPLQIMLDTAHKYGLELHAWINPYRVTMASQGFDDLTDDNFAKKHPEWVVKYNQQLYFNPGVPEVQDYLIETVKELVTKYDVDAVHMDDYFYPGVDFDDSATFKEYGEGFEEIGDWRRHNVNQLVKHLNQNIKQIKPWVQFGISPSGIWRNQTEDPKGSATDGQAHYDALFADSQHWIQEGSLDYITPQIYWSRGLAIASYSVLLDWWSKSVEPYPVNLYIGMADYKVNNNFDTEWNNVRELPDQILANRSNHEAQGQMHFTLRDINNNALGYSDIIDEELYNYKALTPAIPWNGSATPNQPESVTIEEQENGVGLTMRSNEANVRKFVIYRFEDKEKIDYNDPANVIGVVYNKQDGVTFIDGKGEHEQSAIYGVTSISQTGIESETGSEVRWPPANKSELEELAEQVSQKDPNDYTEESWLVLQTALMQAYVVIDNQIASQEEVDAALVALAEGIAQLEELSIDKTELDTVVKQASEREEEDYTEESWTIFAAALEKAIDVLGDDLASQEEVDAALVELTEGVAQLKEAEKEQLANKTELKRLIEQATERKAEDYTEASWEAFTNVLTSANQILVNDEATQQEVDEITADLKKAIKDLQAITTVNKDKLASLIAESDDKKEQDYTLDSWKIFSEVLKNAKDLLVDETANSDDIEQMITNLKEALAQLEKKPQENGVIGGGHSVDKPSHGEGTSHLGKGEGLPKTATNAFNSILLGSFMLILGFLLFLINRKRVVKIM